MAICTPAPWIWLLLPVHLLALGAEGLLLALAKRQPRVWHDIYAGVAPALARRFHDLQPLRVTAQQTHRVSASDYRKGFVAMPRKLQMALRHGFPDLRQ